MKKLIEDNYQSIVKRGLINPKTTVTEFLNKLDEEIEEFKDGYEVEELADMILVLLNCARHFDIDIEHELIKKIKINEQRGT